MSERFPPLGTPELYNGWKDVKIPNNENIYQFVTNTYEGSGGYITGDYLDVYDKETTTDRRKRLVYFKNYVHGIVDSLIVPVFSDEARRETNNELFKAFLGDVDNKDNNIQEFTHTVIKYARMHGVCFTVMDNFNAEEIPDTMTEAIAQRKYPYIYFKTADEVESYTTDRFNALETISFKDGWYKKNDGSKVKMYRLWTAEYSVRYIIGDENKMVPIEDAMYHNLGFLPVIATYNNMDSDILPHPPVYDLCRMNYTIYNMDSEQRNLERLCAFPMLTIQTKEYDINMNIGADSLITYGGDFDGSISAPSWINPSADILTVMNNLSNEVVQKLVESSNVLGAVAINTGNQAKSGVAMSYEFMGSNFALKHTARMAENYEKMVSIMFGLFINESVEYVVEYKDNYQPSQDEVDKKLSILERIIDLGMSPAIEAEIKKEIIKDISSYYKFDVSGNELAQTLSELDTL